MENTQPININEPLLEWSAPSKVNHERSAHWYAVAGMIGLLIIIYGLVDGGVSLSIVMALCMGLFYLVRNESHPVHRIRIMPLGIQLNNRFEPWNQWKNFWILQGPDYGELHVSSNRAFKPELVIQTGSIDPFVIRDTLLHFLPQNEHSNERLLDAIFRFCKL